MAVWDKNQPNTTVSPSVSTVTFTQSDTVILQAFSQGGGGAGCFAFNDTIVRGYTGASGLVVTAEATSGTNPNNYTMPYQSTTVAPQFLAIS